MPRKKVPGQVLENRGSFRKNPQRRRTGEPTATGPLGNPPASFKPDEREAWREIVKRAPLGVLTAADWHAVVLASKLFAEAMRDCEAMNAARLSRLQSLLGCFGMTPSDRAGLAIPKAKAANPFAALESQFPGNKFANNGSR